MANGRSKNHCNKSIVKWRCSLSSTLTYSYLLRILFFINTKKISENIFTFAKRLSLSLISFWHVLYREYCPRQLQLELRRYLELGDNIGTISSSIKMIKAIRKFMVKVLYDKNMFLRLTNRYAGWSRGTHKISRGNYSY